MIVDAIVVIRNINKKVKRLDVFSPKFGTVRPVFSLSSAYEGRPVKFVTGWGDISIKEPMKINGSASQYGKELTTKVTLTRGMIVECGEDNNIYICMPEVMIK